jgi:hypothetical protein
MKIILKGRCHYEMVLIYQPPNVHVRISGILLYAQRNGGGV